MGLRILLIAVGFALGFSGIFTTLRIEQVAGYYDCPPIVIIVTFLLLSPFFRNVREPYSVYEMPPLPEEGVAEENGIEGIIQTRILRSRTITPLVF